MKNPLSCALSKAIPEGQYRLDRESAVQTAQCSGNFHCEMLGFKVWWFKAPPNEENIVNVWAKESYHMCAWRAFILRSFRDGETTIKIKFALLRGGGLGEI